MPDKQDFEKARNKSVLFFTAEGSLPRNGLVVDEHILVFTGGAATSPTSALQIFNKEREDEERELARCMCADLAPGNDGYCAVSDLSCIVIFRDANVTVMKSQEELGWFADRGFLNDSDADSV